jgi:uncharacterized protein (TIGR03067 family)
MMSARCWPVAGLLLLIGAGSADAGELDGIWKLAALETQEGKTNLPEPRPWIQFAGNKLLYGGEPIAKISADAATTPKVIDVRFEDKEERFEGIYATEGKTLRICLNGRSDGAKMRPIDFALDEQPARRVLHLEKASAEDTVPGAGFIGIALGTNEDRTQVLVQAVLEYSPAKKAGLQAGDQLVAVLPSEIKTLPGAVEIVRQLKPGTMIIVRIARDGKERDLSVQVAPFPFRLLAGLE